MKAKGLIFFLPSLKNWKAKIKIHVNPEVVSSSVHT